MSHFYSFKGNTQQLEKFKELEKKCTSEKIFVKKDQIVNLYIQLAK